VVGEDGSEPHGPRMQDGLMAQAAKTSMPMDNLDAFADGDVSEDGKEGEDGWEGRLAVDDEEGDIVDLEAVGQVAYARTASIGVCYDNDLVSTVDEFAGQLVHVALHSSGLRVEVVADHGNIVRHADDL